MPEKTELNQNVEGQIIQGPGVQPPAEEQKLKWWQVLWGTIRRPGSTFRKTQGRAGLLLPTLMMLGGAIFVALAVAIVQEREIVAMMYESMVNAGMSPEEIENTIALAGSPWVMAIGVIGAVFGALISWLIYAGVMHLAVRVLGGKGTFRQAFGIVGWAWVALFIGSLLQGTYYLITGSIPEHMQAVTADSMQEPELLKVFLSQTHIFAIWNMVLLTIGFAVVYGISKKKAAIPVIIIWLATVLIAYWQRMMMGQSLGTGM